MPIIVNPDKADFMLSVTSGGFGVYVIDEVLDYGHPPPSPGFVGSWVLCGSSVSSGGHPWSPPANVTNSTDNIPLYSSSGLGAYSVNGELYTFIATPSAALDYVIPGGTLSTYDTGISVVESSVYGLATVIISGTTHYVITSANGRVWQSLDFVTWTEVTSGFIPVPAPSTITQGDLNNANNNAPPGVTFVFGTPSELCAGGVNSHTGPPFATRQEGGAIEYNVPNNNISTRGGAIELTASITGPLPPAVGQGGLVERVGIPVRQEG
jgi:hypothetical protein